MATLTTEKSVADVLGDGVMTVADLIAKTSEAAVAKAWAAGLLVFGRRQHVVVGRRAEPVEGEPDNSKLLLEGPPEKIEWGETKTARHAPLADILKADRLPDVHEYCSTEVPRKKLIEKDNVRGNVEYTTWGNVARSEAERQLALMVKLSDRGLLSVSS